MSKRKACREYVIPNPPIRNRPPRRAAYDVIDEIEKARKGREMTQQRLVL